MPWTLNFIWITSEPCKFIQYFQNSYWTHDRFILNSCVLEMVVAFEKAYQKVICLATLYSNFPFYWQISSRMSWFSKVFKGLEFQVLHLECSYQKIHLWIIDHWPEELWQGLWWVQRSRQRAWIEVSLLWFLILPFVANCTCINLFFQPWRWLSRSFNCLEDVPGLMDVWLCSGNWLDGSDLEVQSYIYHRRRVLGSVELGQ